MSSSSQFLYTITPALKTIFTPPSQCLHQETLTRGVDTIYDVSYLFSSMHYIFPAVNRNCFPSGFSAATQSIIESGRWTSVDAPFYSPDLVCPS